MTEFDPRPRSQRHPPPPRPGLADVTAQSRLPRRRRDRWLGIALSVTTHLVAFVALVFAWVPPPPIVDPPPITVSLIAEPKPPAPPAPPAPKPAPKPEKAKTKPKPVRPKTVVRRLPQKPPPPRHIARLAPPHADPAPRHAGTTPSTSEADVSDAELANAADAGSGGGGGG